MAGYTGNPPDGNFHAPLGIEPYAYYEPEAMAGLFMTAGEATELIRTYAPRTAANVAAVDSNFTTVLLMVVVIAVLVNSR